MAREHGSQDEATYGSTMRRGENPAAGHAPRHGYRSWQRHAGKDGATRSKQGLLKSSNPPWQRPTGKPRTAATANYAAGTTTTSGGRPETAPHPSAAAPRRRNQRPNTRKPRHSYQHFAPSPGAHHRKPDPPDPMREDSVQRPRGPGSQPQGAR